MTMTETSVAGVPSMLDQLFEQRDAADKAFSEYATPLMTEARERDLTEEENSKLEELRADRRRIADRILKAEEDSKLAEEIKQARERLGTADVRIENIKEPRMYGEDSPNSYFADLCRSSTPAFPGHAEASERLSRYAVEVAGEMRDSNSAEGKRAYRALRNSYREMSESNPSGAKEGVDRAAHYTGVEIRNGMSTGTTSGGSFVTPQYFVAQYAAYRQFGRVFADAANKHPLPDYGVTINLPHLSGPAGVSAQVGENQGITELDPTAGYLTSSLVTNAGQVTVSQQLLDRAGPNFQFDKMVFDQLLRAYNLTLDVYVLTQALANANAVTVTNTTLYGTASFYNGVASAKAQMKDTAGTVLAPTHIFIQPVNWEWFTVQNSGAAPYNSLVTPNYAGPYNALAAGSENMVPEGDTGFKLLGLPVYEDANIPVHSSNNQAIVAHMPEVWFWEGELVNRTIPQTVAQNLSVLLQTYAYVAEIVRYSNAVQALQGAALPTSPSF